MHEETIINEILSRIKLCKTSLALFNTVVYSLRLFYYFDGRWKLERLALLRVIYSLVYFYDCKNNKHLNTLLLANANACIASSAFRRYYFSGAQPSASQRRSAPSLFEGLRYCTGRGRK